MKAAWLAVLLAGCGTMPLPHLEPHLSMREGLHEVCMAVELMSPEQVTLRCNHGIPGGDRIGCTFSRANPPLVIAPMPATVNDWQSKGILGHEVLHVLFGEYHR